jgi:hypothetical protein
MRLSWEYRARFWPARVRLLLIAESPPHSVPGSPLRHFYHPAAPSPDTLFRVTAPVLLPKWREDGGGRWSPTDKEAALAELAARGFLLLDGAQCPVNHLSATGDRRGAVRRCADVVLRALLSDLEFALGARICPVVRGTVPAAVVPVLDALGLADRLAMREGLPFPGRWSGHRDGFQAGLAQAAASAGWWTE